MKALKTLPAIVLSLLLAACLVAFFYTRDSSQPAAPAAKSAEQSLVDNSLLQAALKLAPLATTPEEQAQAREALRLADHELDLSFAVALRQAEAEPAAPIDGPLRQLRERVIELKDRVDSDRKRVEQLTKSNAEDLDLARAQLQLDEDELDNAQSDISRHNGDKRSRLQRLLQEHEASDKLSGQGVKFGPLAPAETLYQQIREWLALADYTRQLKTASEDAAVHALGVLTQRLDLDSKLTNQPESAPSIERIRQLSAQRKAITGLDQSLQDTKQLTAVYQRWSALAQERRRSVLHLGIRSTAMVLGILLSTLLLSIAIGRLFPQTDRRRLHQLRVIARISLQLVAVIGVLLIFLGPPTQLSTMIGLVTAGLTVVMKDFIVAFFGWFTLMGKNGVGVGDWVEIEGVSGEVIEIGILKTVLLELGNWTETGHPTGRRVAFSNSFAMERHYFNFSTSGQWLWDELKLTLPPADDPYQDAQKIREIVERETKADAAEAAEEWQRVTRQYGARELAAGPAVNLRPALNGLEVVVRYITRAPNRNAMRSKLFQSIVELLRKPA